MARSNFIVRGGADFSGIKKELVKTQTQLQGFQAKVSGIMKGIGIVLSTLAVGKLIKDSTAAAMSVESAMNNISHNMGNAAKAFQNWVDTQSKALGMAKADAYTYGSTFSNLLSSFTSGAEDTAQKTQELMKAAAIIASKTGRTYEDVANRIRSGMLGSTEAIEDLGVYVNISMLEATDAFKKFAGNKSWSQLTFQQQQQIRLAAILEQTYKRYGDTLADTTQTRQAQFLASLQNIKLSLGQAFLPIYNAVLPALTTLADALGRVINTFAQFVQALFGKTATTQAKAVQQQAVAMTELGDATEEAAKKANKNLQSFDEVHQLQEEMSDTAAGGVFTADTAAVAPMELEDVGEPEAFSKFQEVLEKLAVLFGPVADGFHKLKKAAEPVIKNIGKGLKWFYDNVLAPFGKWTISEALPAWLNMIAASMAILNPIIEAFKPLAIWLWENFLQPIASWVGDAYIAWLNMLTEAFRNLGDWMAQNQAAVTAGLAGILSGILAYQAINNIPAIITTVKTALSGLGAAFSALKSPIGLVVAAIAALVAGFVYFYTTNESFRGTVDSILKAIADAAIFLWENALKPLGEFLATVFVAAWDIVSKAAQWLWQNVLVPFGNFLVWLWNSVLVPVGSILVDVLGIAFQTVADIAKSFWENVLVPLGNALAEMFGPAVEAVSAVLSFLWNDVFVPFAEFLISIFKPIIEALIKVFEFLWRNVFKPLAEFVGGVFVAVFDNMFKSIGDIIGGLKNIFIGLMNFITGVFTGNWEKAWEGVKNAVKGIFDGLVAIVKAPINTIINGVNTMIRGLNKFSIDIPDWLTGLAGIVGIKGGKFGFNIPEIPTLGKGGLVTQPTMAIIGEAGTEAVMPLERNTGWIDELARKIAAIISSQGGSSTNNEGTIILQVNIGPENILEKVIGEAERRNARAGRTVIPIGVT